MKTPKSDFIKNKIKNLKFNEENKEYIDDLILLERFILEGDTFGFAGGWKANGLKSQYRSEYNAIYKELLPNEFKKEMKRETKEKSKEKRELEKFDKEEKKELSKSKKEWLKLGGKI